MKETRGARDRKDDEGVLNKTRKGDSHEELSSTRRRSEGYCLDWGIKSGLRDEGVSQGFKYIRDWNSSGARILKQLAK